MEWEEESGKTSWFVHWKPFMHWKPWLGSNSQWPLIFHLWSQALETETLWRMYGNFLVRAHTATARNTHHWVSHICQFLLNAGWMSMRSIHILKSCWTCLKKNEDVLSQKTSAVTARYCSSSHDCCYTCVKTLHLLLSFSQCMVPAESAHGG